MKQGSGIVSALSSGGSYCKAMGQKQSLMGSPEVIIVIIIIKTDVFLLEGKESSPSSLFCSFKKSLT